MTMPERFVRVGSSNTNPEEKQPTQIEKELAENESDDETPDTDMSDKSFEASSSSCLKQQPMHCSKSVSGLAPSAVPSMARVQSVAELTTQEKSKQNEPVLVVAAADDSEEQRLLQAYRRRERRRIIGDNRVTFTDIEIREYPITLGDNPGGFRGAPLTIDWDHQVQISLTINDYEKDRPPRRSGSQMNIPAPVREEMLRHSGFSRGELQDSVKYVNIARRQRKRTEEILNLSSVEEFLERVKRKSLNLTVNVFKKRQEREYIRNAMKVHKKLEKLNAEEEEALMKELEEEVRMEDNSSGPMMLNESSIMSIPF